MIGDFFCEAPPSLMMSNRYLSLRAFIALPLVMSPGFGFNAAAAGPSPFPAAPWQPTQLASYFALPAFASPFDCAKAMVGVSAIASPKLTRYRDFIICASFLLTLDEKFTCFIQIGKCRELPLLLL